MIDSYIVFRENSEDGWQQHSNTMTLAEAIDFCDSMTKLALKMERIESFAIFKQVPIESTN